MGIHTVLPQGLVQIILASLSIYASQSHGSPLSDNNNNLCPRGWYHYERFCVTRGQGPSDRAVALYCDGFGGIGIKGLCIIKVHTDPASNLVKEDNAVNFSQGLPVTELNNLEPAPENDPVYATVSKDGSQVSPYSESALEEDASSSNFLEMNILENRVEAESGLCPRGWTHYRSMCIYRPWSVGERCHFMNAVEFQGLCIKHADTKAAVRKDLSAHSKEKRICCCASFKAKGNNYGC